METDSGTPDDQPNGHRFAMGFQIGPDQSINPIYFEPQHRADSNNLQEHKENENEMEANNETQKENALDVTSSELEMDANIENQNGTYVENECEGDKMEKLNEPNESYTDSYGLSNPQVDDTTNDTLMQPEEGTEDENEFGLTSRQLEGLNALLNEPTTIRASRKSGIPERTLRRWMANDDNFRRALRELNFRSYEFSSLQTMSLQQRALEGLEDLLENPTQPGAAAKQKAIDAILRRGDKCYELMSTNEKIERLYLLGGEDVQNRTREA